MSSNADMNFDLPSGLTDYLAELDAFIEAEINPLEQPTTTSASSITGANGRAPISTSGGLPRHEWEALLRRAKRPRRQGRPLPLRAAEKVWRQGRFRSVDGGDPRTFRSQGLGLHNDLQNEHSIVGNLPFVTMLDLYGRPEQQAMIEGCITGKSASPSA